MWIPIYKTLAQTDIVGYLYGCSSCYTTLKYSSKLQSCPQCKAEIDFNGAPESVLGDKPVG